MRVWDWSVGPLIASQLLNYVSLALLVTAVDNAWSRIRTICYAEQVCLVSPSAHAPRPRATQRSRFPSTPTRPPRAPHTHNTHKHTHNTTASLRPGEDLLRRRAFQSFCISSFINRRPLLQIIPAIGSTIAARTG